MKNASIHAVINLETREDEIHILAYGTQEYPNARILLTYGNETLLDELTLLSPVHTYEKTLHTGVEDETRLTLKVLSEDRELVSYTPLKKELPKLPSPAKVADDPERIMTNEELYLTGLHIEQYRHATYRPDPYYIEGLKRDPGDIRINNTYGSLLMRRGCFEEAEEYFRKALKRAVLKNPNPYDSEPYYNLGLALLYQRKIEEAFDAFYKATWSGEQQEMSFYYLSCIESIRGNYDNALELVEKGLVRNTHNIKARALKAYLLRRLGRTAEARAFIAENLKVDSFDYVSRMESAYLEPERQEEIRLEINRLARAFHENYLMAARHYAEFGAYEAAVAALDQCSRTWPILYYYKAFYQELMGKDGSDALQQAESCSTDYCFPNKLEHIAVLKLAAERNPKGANAYYYLGNLYYDKLQYRTALSYWEQSARLNPRFPTVWRNLSLAYYNKEKDRESAREAMEKAYSLNPADARIFLELDQLYKKLNMTAAERLEKYEAARDVFMKRDDLMIEYATLLNLLERYGEAYEFIMIHKFHPWEGGEGKVTAQYVVSLAELARQAMDAKEWRRAEDYLIKALKYPENLGEGKLEGTKDNHINYYLGMVMESQGRTAEAGAYFEAAGVGTDEPAGMMYYYDQPADMIYYQGLAKEKLGKPVEARARFYKLLDYGEQHMSDTMKIEYFAVSLPDFLIYEDDLDKKNKAHCNYLIGLGKMGLGDMEGAKEAFKETIRLDNAHLNAIRYMNMITEK